MITKQALGNLLFGMADILRDKVENYKSYILSLLFFKRLSDNYQWEIEHEKEQFIIDYVREPSPRELEVIAKKKHDFTIPDGCFWDDVRLAPIDKKNEKLDAAVNAIAEQNIDKNGKYFLKGIINTEDKVKCEGVFTKYAAEGYAPQCWIWTAIEGENLPNQMEVCSTVRERMIAIQEADIPFVCRTMLLSDAIELVRNERIPKTLYLLEHLRQLYIEREPVYRAAADEIIPVTGTPEDTADAIGRDNC